MVFKPNTIDQYAFLRDDAIIVFYVGNCIIFARDKMMVKKICDQLRDRNFIFNEKVGMNKCLGIKIDRQKDGSMRS